MSEITKDGNNFVGYEYKEILTDREKASMYLDGYMNFGWEADENTQSYGTKTMINIPSYKSGNKAIVKLKRDRKILNKTELTRLQRHFDACMKDIEVMESSKTQNATIWALIIGFIGTAFMTGSVFAVVATPPMIPLCVILAIPAFIGWILPYFIYKKVLQKQSEKVAPLIEQKYDEIYEICEKGNKLL